MSTTISPPEPATRRRRIIYFAIPLLLIAVIWALPHILAGSSARHWVIARFLPRLDGQVTAGSASLDWFAPVVFSDVLVTDAEGNTVLKVGRIQSRKTLLSLLVAPNQAGTFQLQQADLQLQAQGREFNLEKVLAGYLGRPAGKSTSPGGEGAGAAATTQTSAFNLAVEILNSSISQHDADTQSQIKLEMVNGKINLDSNSTEPVSVELHGTLADVQRPGTIAANFHWLAQDEGQGEFKIETDGMTLAALTPLLRRVGFDLEMNGRVFGECVYRWGRRGKKDFSEIHADLTSHEVQLAGPWIGRDRVILREVSLPCRLALDGGRVQIEKAHLSCDLGKARLAGGVNLDAGISTWLNEPGCTAFADIDLAALANQLPDTLKLQPGTHLLTGRAQLDCSSHRTTEGTAWQGVLTSTGFEGVRGGQTVSWREGFHLDFRARQNDRGLPEIERLHGQSKFLTIDGSGNSEHIQVRLDMDLQKLAEPLGQIVDLAAWRLKGEGWARLAVRRTIDDAYAIDTSGQFSNLQVFKFEDPSVHWRGTGFWQAPDRVRLDDALMHASAFSMQTSGLNIVGFGKPNPRVTGRAVVSGEVSRLRQWLSSVKKPAKTPITGDVLAYLDISEKADPTQMTVDAHFSNIVVGNPRLPTWREPRMRVYTQTTFSPQADTLLLDRFYLETMAIATDAKGKIAEFSGHKDLELEGALRYDLAKLEPALQRYFGADCKLAGQDKKRFQLAGRLAPATEQPLALAHLGGQAQLGWRTLRAWGSDVGASDLHLLLEDGWLHTQPIVTSMNGGKLNLEPHVRLEPLPAELVIGPGTVLEKARITPATSAGILRYALPALAGVSSIDGELSLAVEGVRVPLSAPSKSEMYGKLQIHSARFGGTKLIQDLGDILKAPPPTVYIKDCTVPVKMVDGKVYHQNLTLIFPDTTVRTSGWVAVDGSMELLAEMPIPAKWVSKVSPALAKQTLKLPIRGTLDRPIIDEASLRTVMNQVLRDSAGKLLQGELEDRLKKLLQR